jgi:hypothetical protein
MHTNASSLARSGLMVSGALLLVVGVIHLSMTGHLSHWMTAHMNPEQAMLLVPPSVLNHVVVGILLLPLGASTLIAARALAGGAPWGWWLALANALSMLALPISVLFVMDVSRYQSWPFWIAAGLVFLIPLIMLACVYVLRPH